MIGNIIVLFIIAAVIGLSVWKITSDKKNGVKCSGCPYSKTCSTNTVCEIDPELTKIG
ncbi:FeoB-associated Cys-rich membrane protein [Gudongella sp. DL1XJH-153]|uniref:FeoB-associated Cys-rich membrane protein n=1 Tax=Gudongella sp. DL1XJH-153 TaxID=3409804 RepID=UPI003BB49732